MDLGPWRSFLHAHARLARQLDEDLRSRHSLSLQEYETLLHLAEAQDHRLRMGRLADSLLLSKSGVTRLVDRLDCVLLFGFVLVVIRLGVVALVALLRGALLLPPHVRRSVLATGPEAT